MAESLYAGFDLGGTELKYGLINSSGELVFTCQVSTPSSLESLLSLIQEIWAELDQKYPGQIKAVGFGFAGFFSIKQKRIIKSPNYPALNNFPLFPALKKILPVPFAVHNDANLAAYGEYLYGSCQKAQSLVLLTVGTGLGSGLILGGKLWQGQNGFAGELGHITVNPEGLKCNCGNLGCLETEVSAPALVRNYQTFSGKDEDLTARDIYLRAKSGDEAAGKSFERCGYFLGIALGIIINLLNPEKVILGGGVMKSGNWLFRPAVTEAKRRSISVSFATCEIKKATLGNKAGLIGAAAWAKHQLKDIRRTR